MLDSLQSWSGDQNFVNWANPEKFLYLLASDIGLHYNWYIVIVPIQLVARAANG